MVSTNRGQQGNTLSDYALLCLSWPQTEPVREAHARARGSDPPLKGSFFCSLSPGPPFCILFLFSFLQLQPFLSCLPGLSYQDWNMPYCNLLSRQNKIPTPFILCSPERSHLGAGFHYLLLYGADSQMNNSQILFCAVYLYLTTYLKTKEKDPWVDKLWGFGVRLRNLGLIPILQFICWVTLGKHVTSLCLGFFIYKLEKLRVYTQ